MWRDSGSDLRTPAVIYLPLAWHNEAAAGACQQRLYRYEDQKKLASLEVKLVPLGIFGSLSCKIPITATLKKTNRSARR
jgi:hypothetical protein